MDHFGWPQLEIVIVMLAGFAVNFGVLVAAVWIGLTLWHRGAGSRVHK
jgi:hypothetical protein